MKNQKDKTKKPYEKPRITTEKVYETAALACQKCANLVQRQATGGACRTFRKSS